MPVIRQLPPNLINQIAAGEVIERPASVVKELLENSVDAGSTRIEVTVERGGSDLIRISDDGCGMTAEQLPLAVASHATSKLPTDESLFSVSTLGFRGEALASIGSVSHLLIRSRTADSDSGSQLEVRGGVIDGPNPCGCPTGTVMEIRNLFFNTPVRRKFMRTTQTEMGHISEAFTRIALANPHIHMTLRSGAREIHDLPPTTRWADRIAAFFGGEVADTLIPIDSDDGEVRIHGFVCDPSVSRGNTRMQYLILNGRHIRDRALQHALTEAYRGLLMTGRHPVCFLQLQMPAELIDVNVHPTKLEVRFADGGRVYGRLLQTLRHKFLTSDLTMRVGPGGNPEADNPHGVQHPDQPASQPLGSEMGMAPAQEAAHRQSVIHWARTPADSSDSAFGSSEAPLPSGTHHAATSPTAGTPSASHWSGSTIPPFRPFGASAIGASSTGTPVTQIPNQDVPTASATESDVPGEREFLRADAPEMIAMSHLGFQVHQRYLVTQDEAGMVVVDQHALHERILYERIRDKVLGGQIETQRLLVPEPVSLTPAEREVAIDSAELLAKVGIEIEAFGGDSVVVQTYPAMLSNLQPGDMLRQALESLMEAGRNPEVRDLLDHLLHTIACKAAIKAGDKLTPEEVTSLLEQRELYQDTHHCPHGRPTALFFSRDELDRMFGRLGPRGRTS